MTFLLKHLSTAPKEEICYMDDEIKYPKKEKETPPLTGQAYKDLIEKFRWHREHGDVVWQDRVPRIRRDG